MMWFTDNKLELVCKLLPFVGTLTGDTQVAVASLVVIIVSLIEFGLFAIATGTLIVLGEQYQLRQRRRKLYRG